jgi:hypothetical protein
MYINKKTLMSHSFHQGYYYFCHPSFVILSETKDLTLDSSLRSE